MCVTVQCNSQNLVGKIVKRNLKFIFWYVRTNNTATKDISVGQCHHRPIDSNFFYVIKYKLFKGQFFLFFKELFDDRKVFKSGPYILLS